MLDGGCHNEGDLMPTPDEGDNVCWMVAVIMKVTTKPTPDEGDYAGWWLS